MKFGIFGTKMRGVHIRGICTDRFEYTAQTGKTVKFLKK